ncbi:MAG: SDR family NAD(P)-dependent oxidoreductase [Dehalococcoidia bacterium]
MHGRTVLVTGANHGIGACTAETFAAQGAQVFLTYYGHPAAAAVIDGIRARGGKADAFSADLADPVNVPLLFERAESTFGPIEVLVNNAAASAGDTFDPRPNAVDWGGRPTDFVTAESHDAHVAVNSRAVALTMAEFARRHVARRARWGRIINVSTDGSPGFAGEVSYGASKSALESYSRAAAKELATYGITVNIVSPGATDTGWITPDMARGIVPTIPLGRLGEPQDSADVIVFLASEQARWLTGQTLHVGGGHRMI